VVRLTQFYELKPPQNTSKYLKVMENFLSKVIVYGKDNLNTEANVGIFCAVHDFNEHTHKLAFALILVFDILICS
jgi:hypothetical protein